MTGRCRLTKHLTPGRQINNHSINRPSIQPDPLARVARSDLPESEAVVNGLRHHECGDQVVDGASLAAVRAEHERVQTALPVHRSRNEGVTSAKNGVVCAAQGWGLCPIGDQK